MDIKKFLTALESGTRIKRNCAPGLHFSRELRMCTSPEAAECKEVEMTCPKEDDFENLVFLPHAEKCHKYYL
jgi:hypothetical protein